MKTFYDYYKLILISMAIVVFLPLNTLMAEDYWDWSTYATSDQSPDYHYGDYYVYKDVDITENACERNFDDAGGTGFSMSSDWTISITASVRNYPEEAYSNSFELEAQVYHFCEMDWEWSGPPASAPGATIEYYLDAEGQQYTEGHRVVADGTPYTGASSYIFCNAYSWPHDSQGYGYFEVDAALWGSVSDSSNSHERYWDCTPEQDAPYGFDESNSEDYQVSYDEWEYDDGGGSEYEVSEGIGTFSANGGAGGFADAAVGIIAYEGDTGQTWVYDYAVIDAESVFTMTSN